VRQKYPEGITSFSPALTDEVGGHDLWAERKLIQPTAQEWNNL
jgi:hypothetical protein